VKRLIAFLVLLALGLVALKFAIGDEEAVRANGNQSKRDEQQKADRDPEPVGVRIESGQMNATVSQTGRLDYPKRREIDLGNGNVRKELVYWLKADDSRPIGDGLQQLTGVTLQLYDKAEHAATVTASRAFLELGRDANGHASFDEQKAIDLRDAVITSEPDSRLAGMRLELGDAKINIGDDEIQLTTEAEQPVKMTLEGRRTATLTGRGARARLPRDQRNGLQQASVTILSDPVLETDDVRVRAKGRMHYVENTVTGAARITLDDDVELDLDHGKLSLAGSEPRQGDGKSTVRGDQFTGWLLRSREQAVEGSTLGDNRGEMIWQRLVLVGAPATIDMPGVHVDTPRITVRPGPLGDPCVVTAHGGESRIEQTELRPGSKQKDVVVGISPRRIHLVRPGDSIGALHRGMGFPRWTTRPLDQQQVVVFLGSSRLESGARKVVASDGLMVTRRGDCDAGTVQGFGTIELFQKGQPQRPGGKPRPDLHASGNDGVQLIVSGTDAGDEERMRLGPVVDTQSARWRQHRYEVRYGESRLEGLGSCDVVRAGERTDLMLRAPFDEIAADFGHDGTRLRNVRQLRATLDGELVTDLDVGGLPVRATLVQDGEQLRAQAPRLRRIGPRSLQLLPMDIDESPWSELAELDRTPRLLRDWTQARPGKEPAAYQVEVFGPRIDVHHAGGRTALVDAHGDDEQPARIYAKLPQAGSSEPATVTCAAARLRVLPFVLSPETTAMHFGGGGAMRSLATHALARPWLLVDDVRDFQLDDEQQGHIEGSGHRMLISQGGAAALFLGDPDAQTPAIVRRTHEGREVVVQGARVRIRNEDTVRLSALGTFDDRSTFLAPTMTLHEPGASGLLSHMQAVCRGNIHVDPEAVRFTGPVEAFGLLPEGEVDPEGLHIDARQLTMLRQQATGRVTTVKGDDVHVDWTRLDAKAAKVELDLLNERCVASDPKAAVITTPDGRQLRSTRIAVNYLTWEISMGPGSASQAAPVESVAREEGSEEGKQ
jgi:hypothetical protein